MKLATLVFKGQTEGFCVFALIWAFQLRHLGNDAQRSSSKPSTPWEGLVMENNTNEIYVHAPGRKNTGAIYKNKDQNVNVTKVEFRYLHPTAVPVKPLFI